MRMPRESSVLSTTLGVLAPVPPARMEMLACFGVKARVIR